MQKGECGQKCEGVSPKMMSGGGVYLTEGGVYVTKVVSCYPDPKDNQIEENYNIF